MADIIKSSFLETNQFDKVLFQRGRPVMDYELNELQDIQRVNLLRSIYGGTEGTSILAGMVPWSNDNGFLCVGSGLTNQVTVSAGTLFVDGIMVELFSPYTLSGFTTPTSVPNTQTVYIAVTEVEVTDPAQLAIIGETSRRRQLQTTINVSTTGPSGVPTSTTAEIWQGGIHYYTIATVTRNSMTGVITSGNVTDNRKFGLISLLQDSTGLRNGSGSDFVQSALVSGSGYAVQIPAGSVRSQIQAIAGNINASPYLLVTAGGTITLPDASSNAGLKVYVSDIGGVCSLTTPTTVARTTISDQIDKVLANYSLTAPYGKWIFVAHIAVSGINAGWTVFSC